MENWTSMQIAQKSISKSIQNECAADTAGGVQRGLGMLPQQAICEDWPKGEIKKMSKPVQVYTACQFVTPIICGQNYSQVGNKKPVHLHPNWAEVPNPTSARLEQKLIRTCSQLGHKLYMLEGNWQAGQSYSTLLIFTFSPSPQFAKWLVRESSLIPFEHQFHWWLLVHPERCSYNLPYEISNRKESMK